MTTNTIQLLMQQPAANHDVAWLQNALQAAIQLELATLPPVAEMTPIPEGGYTNPPAAAVAPLSTCDQNFTDMLTALDAAWANGSAASLGAAIGSMGDLGDNARTLLTSAIARTDAPGIYGPQFRLK
jgi:hypothetical protein